MALRPYWSGNLRMSLVTLPVSIYSALNRSRTIAMHEIYRKTGQRIRHQNVTDDGTEVERDDIIKGYEVEKGEYVLIEPDEIKDLKIPSSRTLDIVQFADAADIDDIYFDSPYFVAPQKSADEDTFAVIRDALRQTKKVGLGQLAIGGRERLCSVKPCGSGLLLHTLRYEDELRESDPYFEDIDATASTEELDLAKELIRRKTADFDAGKFKDHYRQALQELIDSKNENREPTAVEEDRPAAKVINLMDALRKSLQDKEGEKPAAKPKAKTTAKTKSATAKTSTKAPRKKAS
ncbi:non-homologous end joining protein Ku [Asticcacaulis endophyticus]|uniref:Non-homologous end joining protein Ku n=1 Tax=Asticcacaulis endophyticus TaxID=1395890 RepID=A0A918Q8R8_9CAUL|nr:Ku protein [Asticcacaulis endophyticus]GGZ34912.1 non-homologous end joining protein Ku [Asticcacaulis endophyticus]